MTKHQSNIDKNNISKAYRHISARRDRPWKGEEEVRIAWVSALEEALNIHFDTERPKKMVAITTLLLNLKLPVFLKVARRA